MTPVGSIWTIIARSALDQLVILDGVLFANAVGKAVCKNGKAVVLHLSFVDTCLIYPSTIALDSSLIGQGTYNDMTSLEYLAQSDGSVGLTLVVEVQNNHTSTWYETVYWRLLTLTWFTVVPITKDAVTEGEEALVDPEALTSSASAAKMTSPTNLPNPQRSSNPLPIPSTIPTTPPSDLPADPTSTPHAPMPSTLSTKSMTMRTLTMLVRGYGRMDRTRGRLMATSSGSISSTTRFVSSRVTRRISIDNNLPMLPECSAVPTGRDALTQADQNWYDGANACTLWNAFANSCLGVTQQIMWTIRILRDDTE
ncbi:hypothetical protein ARMGADRAFT_1077805 [Armillaria gallica]|uniref:Extracellular metalloproteinase n=1 Tax=Armillaria gallica TaxID=47427 RepID=A0A2H3DMF5_ARMGA|nr:hypothetical protein ARMGADRAFT_1077805 [Armillaria gallica]